MNREKILSFIAANTLCLCFFYILATTHISAISIEDINQKPTTFYSIKKPKVAKKKTAPPKAKPKPPKPIPKKKAATSMSTLIEKEPQTEPVKPAEEPIVEMAELDQDISIIHPVIPKYPELARKAEIEAKLLLEVIVDEKGRVTFSKVIFCSQPGYNFEKNAQVAVKKLRFKPFLQDGTPVKVKLVYPIHFVLIE